MNTIRNRVISCASGILLLAATSSTRAADTLISLVDFWFYRDTGVELDPSWRTPEFNHFEWAFGVSKFGFGDGDEFTPLTQSPGGIPLNTAYFRTRFSISDPSIYSNITVRLLRDDGGVVYLNGVEVFRSNMPTGGIQYATSALRNISGADESGLAQRVLPATFLADVNTVAVEIHQAAGDTEDMSFALQLIGHRIGENQPPSAYDSFITVDQDQSVGVTLNATDPDSNPLTYTILAAPQHGSLSGTPPNLTYSPNAGYVGPDLFSFKATDGQWETEIAYVSVDVTLPSNRPPVAQSGSATTAEDTSMAITLSATDPDGDALTFVHTEPAHGTLSGSGSSLVYQPAANYHGPDSFTFTVNDGKGGTATGTVSINVTPVNDMPVAQGQLVATAEDTAISIELGGSDVDGDTLSFAHTQPAHGTVSGSGASVVYTPASNFFGTDSFSFTVDDGNGASATATVSITVAPVNDAPVASAKAAPGATPHKFGRDLIVLARCSGSAEVILDGTASEDVDSTLSYIWRLKGSFKPVSTKSIATVTLPKGKHFIVLTVSDGEFSAHDAVTVQVVTACDLVRALCEELKQAPTGPGERNSPLHCLEAALADFAADKFGAGVQDLEKFQARAREKIRNPVLAEQFVQQAQEIIDLVREQGPQETRKPRGKK